MLQTPPKWRLGCGLRNSVPNPWFIIEVRPDLAQLAGSAAAAGAGEDAEGRSRGVCYPFKPLPSMRSAPDNAAELSKHWHAVR